MPPLPDAATTGALVRRLARDHLRPHWRGIALAVVCTVLLAGLTALYPIVIQQAFDRFSAGDGAVLWLLPPVIIGVVCAKALAQYGQAVAVQSVVLKVIEGLQVALFRALRSEERRVGKEWRSRWSPD